MKWKHPPIIKIYEALGAVADERIEVSSNSGKVYSSTRNKFYTVTYDPDINAIMANDNGSYWQGYLGYPALAFLMKIGILPYEESLGQLLKDIPWKDINQQFKNDFDKTLVYILDSKTKDEKQSLADFVKKIDSEITELDIHMLGEKILPPVGY